jgi:hypothetical protein
MSRTAYCVSVGESDGLSLPSRKPPLASAESLLGDVGLGVGYNGILAFF